MMQAIDTKAARDRRMLGLKGKLNPLETYHEILGAASQSNSASIKSPWNLAQDDSSHENPASGRVRRCCSLHRID